MPLPLVSEPNDYFKAIIVATILDAQPEKALALISRYFHVDAPKIRVGVFKGGEHRALRSMLISSH